MNTLYITIGNVGSGKSTWTRFFAGRQARRIYILDADDIRTMLNGGIYNFNPEIEPAIYNSIIDLGSSLIARADVIIDGLNHKSTRRKRIINIFKENNPEIQIVGILFPPRVEHLERRMNEPRGYSPDHWKGVFNEISSGFEYPELSEGFDEILTIDDVLDFIKMATFKG